MLGTSALPASAVPDRAWPDARIWAYTRSEGFTAIISRDADFHLLLQRDGPPPKIVWLRLGRMRRASIKAFLAEVWPRVEQAVLQPEVRLVIVQETGNLLLS